MPGQKPQLTSLSARKQMLLMESELNRAQFAEAVHDWKHELQRSKQHITQLGNMASTAAKVAATVSSASRLFTRRDSNGKKSWLSFLMNGTATGTSLWFLLRSLRRKKDDQNAND